MAAVHTAHSHSFWLQKASPPCWAAALAASHHLILIGVLNRDPCWASLPYLSLTSRVTLSWP